MKLRALKAFLFTLILACLFLSSCKKYLVLDAPNSEVEREVVFSNDVTAMSALVNVYADLMDNSSFASGTPASVLVLAGLSADELVNYRRDASMVEFENNAINPTNEAIQKLWNYLYRSIYQINSIIEGVDASTGMSDSARNQIKGEVLFVRAFCYFNLVNLFGDVPLVLTTDYEKNSTIERTDLNLVYDQMVTDLQSARELLGDAYMYSSNRLRVNKFAASALLARVYLYQEKWQDAETMASEVINKDDIYMLKDSVSDVFLKNGSESIWELQPIMNGQYGYTNEAIYFYPDYATYYNVLRAGVVNEYEPGDRRFTHWIDSTHVVDAGLNLDTMLYVPRKYKQISASELLTEYSVILRLAEQYLIRAEARAMQNNLTGANSAESDINKIRSRAGIPPVNNLSQSQLIQAILKERRLELMAESGHRWFDLKRLGKAEEILQAEKGAFNSTDELYPLPANEFLTNPMLRRQNEGY